MFANRVWSWRVCFMLNKNSRERQKKTSAIAFLEMQDRSFIISE